MKNIIPLILISIKIYSQPWNNPLRITWSTNGVNFNTSEIYQDSAGVPCVIRWKADTLICVFQWFRQPVNSNTWDKVAVKFSYDNGNTWTTPQPALFHDIPPGYQRPFDPTVVKLNGDSIRMYFSSSQTFPPQGDSAINTYSAISSDGIRYYFEPGARVDVISRPVVDPAIIYFNGLWRYIAPVGLAHEGAYYYTSTDGLNFSYYGIIPGHNSYNWIGNLMLNNPSEMRFYGSGNILWFNSTYNGTNWTGYINTNLTGGDPSVLKISENNYMMIYVGQPYTTSVKNAPQKKVFPLNSIYPNPFNSSAKIKFRVNEPSNVEIGIYDITGKFLKKILEEFKPIGDHEITYIADENLSTGSYICILKYGENLDFIKFVYLK